MTESCILPERKPVVIWTAAPSSSKTVVILCEVILSLEQMLQNASRISQCKTPSAIRERKKRHTESHLRLETEDKSDQSRPFHLLFLMFVLQLAQSCRVQMSGVRVIPGPGRCCHN